MALKAGYLGVKSKFNAILLKIITNFGDALPIKTIGDGLELTSAGVLNCTIDPAGVDYSTDEVDTKVKWIDGKEIYLKVLTYDTVPSNGTVLLTDVDEVIQAYGSQYWAQGGLRTNFPRENLRYEVKDNNTVTLNRQESAVVTDAKYAFFYTKKSS